MQQKNVLSQVSYNNYDRFTYIKIFEFNTQAIAKNNARLTLEEWARPFNVM